jgi:hypothetical protein
MTVDLDARLRSAGDSLVQASERLSPAVPPRSLRPVAVMLAGVVAAAALAAGSVAVLADSDDDAPDTFASTAVPRLVADVLPDGLRPSGVIELPTDEFGANALTQSISLYGDPAAEDPFAASDLAVLTIEGPLLPYVPGEPVTVRGHEGLVDDALPFATTVYWEEAEGFTIGLASRTLAVDQLVAIAEGLAVDGEARTVDLGPLPDALPGRLALVADADIQAATFELQGTGLPLEESTAGHVAAYQPDHYTPFGNAFVATFAGDEADLAVLRWSLGATTATDVRGHAGWSGSYALPGFDDGEGIVPGSTGPLSAVVWEESPGVLVLVQTFGSGLDETRAMAESLRPATDDEWARMLRLGESRDRFMTDEARIAAGQLPVEDRRDAAAIRMPNDAVNGSEGVYGVAGVWSTWLLPDGTICGAVDVVDDDADPVEECDPEGGPVTVVRDDAGEPVLVIGVLPDGAVGRIAVGGEIEEAQSNGGPEDAPPYYILVIADGEAPSAVTFVAADGTEMDTVPVDP